MRKIIMFGAGRSATAAIHFFLDNALQNNWHLYLADADLNSAQQKINSNPNGTAIQLDINDEPSRSKIIADADIVISLLPPALHLLVAQDCIAHKKNLVTASYISPEIKALNNDAITNGVLLMNECGLDPGLDHMSAMHIIDNIKSNGGSIRSFKSYCGGLVAPESNDNPWGYKFSWNPRNVILAGQSTAKFIENGKLKYMPYNRIFTDIEKVDLPGLPSFDGYANRDSLGYRELYGLLDIDTMLRGTLRYDGYCKAWNIFVTLGLTDDNCTIDGLSKMTYAQLLESFLPRISKSKNIYEIIADVSQLDKHDDAINKFLWTGIASDLKIETTGSTPAAAIQSLLEQKWKLQPHDKDMVVMQHQFEYTTADNESKQIFSDLVIKGDDNINTAMAKTVGLPLAVTVQMILEKKINLTGVHLPVMKQIYEPVLNKLKEYNIVFVER